MESNFKHLGVILNLNLNWNQFVTKLSINASNGINILKTIDHNGVEGTS